METYSDNTKAVLGISLRGAGLLICGNIGEEEEEEEKGEEEGEEEEEGGGGGGRRMEEEERIQAY